jgi:vacuolar protein sorting-associated protein 41
MSPYSHPNYFVCSFFQAIIPYFPVARPRLAVSTYDGVLLFLLNADPPLFLTTLNDWPTNIYNISRIISAVETKIKIKETELLLTSLAQL